MIEDVVGQSKQSRVDSQVPERFDRSLLRAILLESLAKHANFDSGHSRVPTVVDPFVELVELLLGAENLFDPTPDSVDGVAADQVDDLVIEFDCQDFLPFAVFGNILEAG